MPLVLPQNPRLASAQGYCLRLNTKLHVSTLKVCVLSASYKLDDLVGQPLYDTPMSVLQARVMNIIMK